MDSDSQDSASIGYPHKDLKLTIAPPSKFQQRPLGFEDPPNWNSSTSTTFPELPDSYQSDVEGSDFDEEDLVVDDSTAGETEIKVSDTTLDKESCGKPTRTQIPSFSNVIVAPDQKELPHVDKATLVIGTYTRAIGQIFCLGIIVPSCSFSLI